MGITASPRTGSEAPAAIMDPPQPNLQRGATAKISLPSPGDSHECGQVVSRSRDSNIYPCIQLNIGSQPVGQTRVGGSHPIPGGIGRDGAEKFNEARQFAHN